MDYKRLEVHVWWTCNQNCTYCIEMQNMEQAWNKRVSKYEIIKTLVKFKKKWYNNVTYLCWELFFKPVFLDALKIWKAFWYTILVTTNASTLHLEKQAKKYFLYIDELILSVEAIDKKLQQTISRSKVFVDWERVFENINKYWHWSYLKANIVITKDNLNYIIDIVNFIIWKWVKNIAIAYPDIAFYYHTKKHIINRVAPKYSECISIVEEVFDYCNRNNINLKITDIPFCIFPKNNLKKYIRSTDDFDYWTRVKISSKWLILHDKDLKMKKNLPRDRFWEDECEKCIYKWKCWGPSIHYKDLFWLDEIKYLN